MLKQDVNELLTRTGPGTEMGDLFRRYWIPALLAEELPEDGCPPVRVKLLSERMVAVRDSEGRYGLLDEFCAHRGASLWFGNNEVGGLRCAYHGWKYDVTGACLEVPSEPENSRFFTKVRLTAYPLVKIGDVLWTYMGDPASKPPLPEFEWCLVPPEQTYTSKRWQESNWLQALEGRTPTNSPPSASTTSKNGRMSLRSARGDRVRGSRPGRPAGHLRRRGQDQLRRAVRVRGGRAGGPADPRRHPGAALMPSATIDGILTRYEVSGDGPPLLMFSPGGFDSRLENWTRHGIYPRIELMARLRERFTCIAFDRRESGRSGGRLERITWAHWVAQVPDCSTTSASSGCT
jgi:nitrite reductase/ring-hydroxylating ferredoxin subunit